MFGKIKQFYRLPFSQKQLFVKICLIVPTIEILLKFVGFNRTVKLLQFTTKKTVPEPCHPQNIINRHRNYLYLYTKQFPFFGKCLAQSLTLWTLLKNKGIQTDLKFGMKKNEDKLLAHAWVEYNNVPLASESEIREKYLFFSESILAKLENQ
jgi:hypothetical protein